MNFAPKSDRELSKVLPKGEYDFEVLDSQDAVSKKSGNDMIKLHIAIYKDGEIATHLYDYLMESIAYKLKHFCYAVGLGKKYECGTLQAYDCTGRMGKCKVGVQEDKTGQYPPKNSISDYIVIEGADQDTVVNTTSNDPGPSDEDLPF